MSLDLSTLALYTRISPAANISVYARPYKPSSDKFLCCSDARMGKTMERIKHSASSIEWYQRLLCASGSITIEWVARVSQWKYHNRVGR